MSLNPFPVMTESAALTTVQACCGQDPYFQFSILQLILAFYSPYLKKVLEMCLLEFTHVHHIKRIHLLHVIRELMTTNDNCQINYVPM
jgi:hypothetical protein